MDENTSLLKELASFNDVPLTQEDIEEMQFEKELQEKEKAQEQAVIAQVLREAGVDYASNYDDENYC
jgi:hypothetical protein